MLTPDSLLQGRYRVTRQLAKGGMGTVYEASDERLSTIVALKECHFEDERLRKQFEREAKMLARLRHPAITRVIDHFPETGGQFLVMDFVAGEELSALLDRRGHAFDAETVLQWADQLLDALAYLHAQVPPVIHRDIKPQNLKLTPAKQVILLDFGLAKDSSVSARMNSTGSIFGYTPNYAPLEQIQGAGTDHRSDLYSLGATLYHLATAVIPPDVLTRLAATTDGRPDPLKPASDIRPEIPAAMSEALHRALAVGRGHRFESATGMRTALRGSNPVVRADQNVSAQASTVVLPPTPPADHEVQRAAATIQERAAVTPPPVAPRVDARAPESPRSVRVAATTDNEKAPVASSPAPSPVLSVSRPGPPWVSYLLALGVGSAATFLLLGSDSGSVVNDSQNFSGSWLYAVLVPLAAMAFGYRRPGHWPGLSLALSVPMLLTLSGLTASVFAAQEMASPPPDMSAALAVWFTITSQLGGFVGARVGHLKRAGEPDYKSSLLQPMTGSAMPWPGYLLAIGLGWMAMALFLTSASNIEGKWMYGVLIPLVAAALGYLRPAHWSGLSIGLAGPMLLQLALTQNALAAQMEMPPPPPVEVALALAFTASAQLAAFLGSRLAHAELKASGRESLRDVNG